MKALGQSKIWTARQWIHWTTTCNSTEPLVIYSFLTSSVSSLRHKSLWSDTCDFIPPPDRIHRGTLILPFLSWSSFVQSPTCESLCFMVVLCSQLPGASLLSTLISFHADLRAYSYVPVIKLPNVRYVPRTLQLLPCKRVSLFVALCTPEISVQWYPDGTKTAPRLSIDHI